jgi:Tol biopolymer transport system component
MGDTKSGELSPLLSGTTAYAEPAISPDGKQMVLTEAIDDFDVFSIDLGSAKAAPLIATKRYEGMPFWAAKTQSIVYVTDRNGPLEIWMHKDNEDRPIVTSRDFPVDSTQWFLSPAPSPDGDRVTYSRIEHSGLARLWISSVAGGAPIPLTNHTGSSEFPGAWSPDGNWYVYQDISQNGLSLMKVKTSGQATPVLLKNLNPTNVFVPAWSPKGDWIHANDKGELLISSDGKEEKRFSDFESRSVTFSADGKLLYAIRQDRDHAVLFSLDIATGAKHDIGEIPREMWPSSNLNPAMRLSLSPDGKSLAYSGGRGTANMWLVDGLPAPSKFLGLF